ncbi:ROK family protein [Nissabacter sp. SGAir0207]|uniref:ROK family protein n=1 Tax=Nissabacter sp. SGAir0207 TaxID=2126321 RepID=UPI0010CD5712|nr:ROK family protein [Nissabacter sp. SGAir0207]QCR38234.1 glucokinase [Nissabacter sp. SGAir0207]
MTPEKKGVRAGIDLGGTCSRIVLMENQQELAALVMPTALFTTIPRQRRSTYLAQQIRGLLPAGKPLIGVGIGASGPVNNQTGIIENDDTLACFSHFPLADELAQQLGVPVSIDNDAVAAALGEYILGAGQGSQRMLMVTLGTGVGVALLDRGQPTRTVTGAHPEAGHIPVMGGQRCYCGLSGCWESVAARSALQSALEAHLPEVPYDQQDLASWRRLRTQHPGVAAIFYQYGYHVGQGLNTLLTLYGPDCTLLGGSAAHFFPLFRAGMESALTRAPGYAVNKNIVPCALGDAAGARGAAHLYFIK